MCFDSFGSRNAKRVPKVSINDRFYKVFCSTLMQTPKRCLADGFLMFCKIEKRIELIMKTLLFFDSFALLFRERAPKVSINDWFYAVF